MRQAATKRFPGHELPRESDNTAQDVREFVARGGSACLGAAVGRFTGKFTNDIALLLTEPQSGHVMLVVATKTSSAWQFDLLNDLGIGGRSDFYVAIDPPGRYRRHPDAPFRVGDVREFTSRLPGIGTGAIGATHEVYFFAAGRWVNVPISN